MRLRRAIGAIGVMALLAAGCGGDDEDAAADGTPVVVATTSIWADVLANVACDGDIDVRTLVPAGADPHRFEPSLADRALMDDAAVVFANGLLLEELLEDTLGAVSDAGTPVFRIGDHVSTIDYSSGDETHDHDEDRDADHHDEAHADDHEEEGHDHDEDHDDHEDEGHDHEEEGHDDHEEEGHDHDEDHDADHDEAHDDEGHDHGDEGHDGHEGHVDEGHDDHDEDEEGHDDHEGHDHSGADPHVWFDPTRVSGVLAEIGEQLVTHAGADSAAIDRCVADYQDELAELDSEIAALSAGVPPENRLLVTNHDAMGYFAQRYGFEVVGTVIPSPSGLAETNPAQLEALAQTIEEHGVGAIFAESQHSARDAEALARRVGDVEVVTLFTGTLGEPGSGADTYLGFMRTNAGLIAEALS